MMDAPAPRASYWEPKAEEDSYLVAPVLGIKGYYLSKFRDEEGGIQLDTFEDISNSKKERDIYLVEDRDGGVCLVARGSDVGAILNKAYQNGLVLPGKGFHRTKLNQLEITLGLKNIGE